MTFEEMHKLCLDAQEEVSSLCAGKQWRMCIPYQKTDSDALIGGALRVTRKLLEIAIAAQRFSELAEVWKSYPKADSAQLDELREALAALRHYEL